MEKKIDLIFEGLKEKSTVKQAIYRNTKAAFEQMKAVSQEVVQTLVNRMSEVDQTVVIEFKNMSEFEFQVKFSGDLLIFIMHSNVVTFPDSHPILNTDYVEVDFKRRFFGHIMAYNFMADSIKYSRMQDPGYLIGRMLINYDNKFFLEGVKELDLSKQDIERNDITKDTLCLIVESAIIAAINNDLMAPELNDIEKITVREKVENQQVSRGTKVGFHFNYQGWGIKYSEINNLRNSMCAGSAL